MPPAALAWDTMIISSMWIRPAGRRELRHLRREYLEHLLEAARLALQVRRVVLLDVPPGRLPERVAAGEEEGIPDVRWRLHALGGAGL